MTWSPTTKSRRLLEYPWLVSLLLAVSVIAVYLPVTLCDFVNYDDNEYVTNNPQVSAGLTWTGVKWAFTHAHSANWHPITWLSHMLDCQLYGLHPAGHHLTNLLFHAANTVLLFLFLRYLAGAFWRSAMVAALFGLHPLHVESVAWVSERKDVLSAFFGILCLWAYARYSRSRTEPSSSTQNPAPRIQNPVSGIQNPDHNSQSERQPSGSLLVAGLGSQSRIRYPAPRLHHSITPGLFYVLTFLTLALGLMCKPMLVTWPFVMLLLDFWPLARLKFSNLKSQLPVLLEKLPFIALVLVSCILTIHAQQVAIVPTELAPWHFRLANALVSYVLYIGKLLWPSHLAVIYLHRQEWPFGATAGAALPLFVLSALTVVWAKRRPYLMIGWAWFLGMLVPVIGLLQVGNQSMADRYTYLPATGLMLIAAWGATSFISTQKKATQIAVGLATCVLVGCAFVAQAQMLTWQTSETLFRQALTVDKGNFVAWNNLGNFYSSLADNQPAARCFTNAIINHPGYQRPYNGLACILNNQKRYAEAAPIFEAALKLDPKFVDAHNNLGFALQNLGRTNEALAHYEEALHLDPEHARARGNLAALLSDLGQFDEARRNYEALLKLNERDQYIHSWIAKLLMREGNTEKAIKEYQSALSMDPDSNLLRIGLGDALLDSGAANEAIGQYSLALRSKPDDAEAHYHLALALSGLGDIKGAVEHYHMGMKAFASAPEALNNLAWLLATNPDPAVRNGSEAVRLAKRACELTSGSKPIMMGTLAAAYAEAGRFPDAIATAEKAKALAEKTNQLELAAKNQELLELYQAGKPFHEPPQLAQPQIPHGGTSQHE